MANAVALTATVALTTVVVGSASIISQHFHSGQHESLSAFAPAPRRPRRQWLIATEEGWHNVRVCRYDNEAVARAAFNKIWCARILYNPRGEEVVRAGLGLAHATIRNAMREGYFAPRPPSPTRRALQHVMEAIPVAAAVLPLVV